MPQTSKLTLTLTEDLIKAIKKRSKSLFGTRKGSISHYVEMTLRNDLHLILKDVEEQ
jgi:hypothetical protein